MGARDDSRPLGLAIRLARRRNGWSLEHLAELVGSSASHLSRIERGDRTAVGRDLIGRIAGELRLDPSEVYKSTGTLPREIEAELTHPDVSLAVADGHGLPLASQRALRRISTERRALNAMLRLGALAIPVDAARLLARWGIDVAQAQEGEPLVTLERGRVAVRGRSREERRFLEAHALGHVLAGTETCTYPGFALEEQGANVAAAAILMPAGPLTRIVHEEGQRADPAHSAQALIELVAGRCGVPSWLAAQRMGELGLFAEAAAIPWL